MAGIWNRFVILSCLAVALGHQRKFCRLETCRGKLHTLCLFPSSTPAASCGELGSKGLTPEEKNAILQRHNKWRAHVASGQEVRGSNGPQPPAKNLGPMKWSEEIAESAQRWADQCNYQHDECRNTAEVHVGQNIAFVNNTAGWQKDDLLRMVDYWYNEVEDFDTNQINQFHLFRYPGVAKVGHYTQMIWADSKMLGCGASRYRRKGESYSSFLVCNYAPAGNWEGRPIYEAHQN